MKVIYSPRQSGRTTQMLEMLARDTRRVLLTFSSMEEARLQKEHPQLAERIYYWERYVKLHRVDRKEDGMPKVMVDNADYILEKVIGDWIEVGTFTEEKIETRNNHPMGIVELTINSKRPKT